MYYVNKVKKEDHVINSVNPEKAFNKIQHALLIKKLSTNYK